MKILIQRDWLRRPAKQSRWLSWAQSVRRKQGRSGPGYGFAAMQFLRMARLRSNSSALTHLVRGLSTSVRVRIAILQRELRTSTTNTVLAGQNTVIHQRFTPKPALAATDRLERVVLRPPQMTIGSSFKVREVLSSLHRVFARKEVSEARHVSSVAQVSAILREHWTQRTTRTEEKTRELTELTTRRLMDNARQRPPIATPPVPTQREHAATAESKVAFDTVHTAPWARTAAPSTVDVGRLTEQVIQQIDSRMIAWRERMGKV